MAESHDRFFPDDVDEQIEECTWYQPPAAPDNRLIHDLRRICQEDTSIIQRVWLRLSHLLPPERVESSEWR
jgi:hypothetical protein